MSSPRRDEREARSRLAEDLAKEHEPVLFRIALRLCGDRVEAQDLVQDTFVRALDNIHRFEEGTNARAWLISIQHNLFIDRVRAKRRQRTTPLEPKVDIAAQEPERDPAWAQIGPEDLRAAVDGLGDEFRRVYRLHALEGRSYQEIAATLGIPQATVGTRLSRARRKLKELLMRRVSREPGGER